MPAFKEFLDGGWDKSKPENVYAIPEKGSVKPKAEKPKKEAAPKKEVDPDQAPDLTFEDYGSKVF